MDSTISREILTLSLKQTALNKSLKSSITKSVKNSSCDKAVVELKRADVSVKKSFTAEVSDGLVSDHPYYHYKQQQIQQQPDIHPEQELQLYQTQDKLQQQQILHQLLLY